MRKNKQGHHLSLPVLYFLKMNKNHFFKYISLIFFLIFFNTQILYPISLLERYRGSPEEKALDKQIKAYRPSAIRNMRTFGPGNSKKFDLPLKNRALILEAEKEIPVNTPQKKTSEFRSPVRSRGLEYPRKINNGRKGNRYDYANGRRKQEIGSR